MVAKRGLGVIADVSLTIQIIHDRREARLVPIGELDVHSAGTFAVAGNLAITEQPERLHVDLTQVTFIDSSGVRSLEALMALADEQGIECTVLGRDGLGPDTFGRGNGRKTPSAGEAMVVWSGSTVRRIERPDIP
jgi:anti-anti-sigma factor